MQRPRGPLLFPCVTGVTMWCSVGLHFWCFPADSFQIPPPSFLSAPHLGQLIRHPTWAFPWCRWELSPQEPQTLHKKSQHCLEPQWNPHVLAPKPLSDTFSGVWPTPLAKAHYGRADFSTRSWCLGGITGLDVQTKFWMRGVHHTPKRLGQTLAMLSSPLSPPPLLSHPRIIIFGWITWELFADVVMI